jgi:hypothetical protein
LPSNYQPKLPPPPAQGAVTYYWVCLRRPANPFAGVSPSNPMVVVDAMRFPYIEGTGPLTLPGPLGGPAKVPDPTQAKTIYSVQRYQPDRGGQAVPYFSPPASAGIAPNAPLPATPPPLDAHYGYMDQIFPPPPGLAVTYSSSFGTRGVYYIDPTTSKNYWSTGGTPSAPATGASTKGAFHTLGWANEGTENWVYLPFHDRDFTSLGELLLVPGCAPGLFAKQFVEAAPSGTFVNGTPLLSSSSSPFTYPNLPTIGGHNASGTLTTPPTFPYLCQNLSYTSAAPLANAATSGNWDPIVGPTSGGWYKMLELFEVPSAVSGATGTVSRGVNYDWARQDKKPGLLNLNLIIDEEVFLGLMGNAGLHTDLPNKLPNGYTGRYQQVVSRPTQLNSTFLSGGGDILGFYASGNYDPQVVTLWDVRNNLPAYLPLGPKPPTTIPYNYGAFPLGTNALGSTGGFYDGTDNSIRGAFSDFLKTRHGGSGYLFGPGPEAPFRSLSYPDINRTVMRPAFPPTQYGITRADAGVKNYSIARNIGSVSDPKIYPPALAPRRLFQIPDRDAGNASEAGDIFSLGYTPPSNNNLNNHSSVLTNSASPIPSGAKEHPFFRSEWMQKILNLTTVRTHQYAVWITVGFFEVKQQGDPSLAATNPAAAYDVIGREIGLQKGKNTRHRGFFIVDRLKLTGFDPLAPGSFRDAVIYRRIIE